jgi:protein-tyrosine phosphatase
MSQAIQHAAAQQRPVRLLFVCTGNICRSPTAEGVMRALAAQAGLAEAFELDSAGTEGWHAGEAPDERSQAHALRRGFDLSALRARQVQSADFSHFDWLLALDAGHAATLKRRCPAQWQNRIRLLMDFSPGPRGREVPDPYYGGPEGFEQVLDLVEEGCRALLQQLRPR